MSEMRLRLSSASGQDGTGDAHSGGFPELHSDGKPIIPLQTGAVNDGENVPAVPLPVCACQPGGKLRQLLRGAYGRSEPGLQCGRHGLPVFPPVLP